MIDGQPHRYEKTWFVTVSNQSFYGGGMKIAPHADPQDGKFHILIVHQISRLKLLFVFMSVYWGGHLKYKEVDSYIGEKVSVQFSEPVPFHADGEDMGMTPINMRMLPKSWKIIQNTDHYPKKR